MGKYDDSIPTTTTNEPRPLRPLELTVMASLAAALIAAGIAALIERPLAEFWRWLLIGAMIPLALLLIRSLAPIIVETLEVVTRRDFTGDGVVGRPHPVLVNPAQGQAAAKEQVTSEYRDEFNRFIEGCRDYRHTSERYWASRGIRDTKYQEYRDNLIGAGYAVWNNKDQRQGWRLIKSPEQIIKEIWRA